MDQYIEFLKSIFAEKKRKNHYYSLRAFSRDLGINRNSLSQAFLGKRKLSKKNILIINKNISRIRVASLAEK
jgi:DNA-binding transcriptional regulator YdaS (Cro superfamily)